MSDREASPVVYLPPAEGGWPARLRVGRCGSDEVRGYVPAEECELAYEADSGGYRCSACGELLDSTAYGGRGSDGGYREFGMLHCPRCGARVTRVREAGE